MSSTLPLAVSACVSALSVVYCIYLTQQLSHETRKRNDERRGRIKAEQKLSDTKISTSPADNGSFTFHSIGEVTSAYMKRFGTPRQPGLVETATALIKISPELSNCLSDLEGYSHLWISYVFHKNTNIAKVGADGRPFDRVKALINIPRVKNLKVGVFASRSPHRPNPIGLSLVRLVEVNKTACTLKVAGLDAVNGTPIIDIKPYLPSVESVTTARVPSWVTASYTQRPLLVQWRGARVLPSPVPATWNWLTAEEVLRVIEESLSVSDPRSPHQKDSRWTGELCVAGFQAKFSITAAGEAIEKIQLASATSAVSDESNSSS